MLLRPIKRAALLTAFLLGCQSTGGTSTVNQCLDTRHTHPHEDAAVELVWNYFAEYEGLDKPDRIPPIIQWVEADSFRCEPGWCFGEYIRSHHTILLAWGRTTKRISQTSMAHELCHAWFGDHDHQLCRNDLPPVETANVRLIKAGY